MALHADSGTQHDARRSAHRGALLRFTADPGGGSEPSSYDYFDDALLVIEAGRVVAAGPAAELLPQLPAGLHVEHHADKLLLPGFIDTHIHFPQVDVIGSGGQQLLDWLADYTFPEEGRFGDAAHAAEVAEVFLDELLRNGTTTALVFCTVHSVSVDVLFTAAQRRGLRLIAGKVLMDRNCPDYLRDTATGGVADSRRLLTQWHGRDRLGYAITPRFVATSSPEQLQAAGQLAAEFPDVHIHSHLAENPAEVDWVKQLFPDARSYLDVYDRFGLVRERSVYAHCIHLDDADRQRMATAGSAAAFCPTSNLYLGSGLFDIAAADRAGLRYSVATDVGGGTSFSLLRTLDEACKVAKLTGQYLSPLRAFYLVTLGAARCLGLQHQVGTLAVGSEADFVVVDPFATELLARRSRSARSLTDTLRLLLTLGDDRAIHATYSFGRLVHSVGVP
ncbi:MAG TPA: guanine deaminase [Steroidobacteraceae bacterium]|jgi:guanine deaminase|nr:guanine deaminase [Steroidobacteraceae bacterium]